MLYSLSSNDYVPSCSLTTAFTSATATDPESILPPGSVASVSLPSSLFQRPDINGEAMVGIFFALYDDPNLFPVRKETGGNVNSTLQAEVASSVVAATVGPNFDLMNLDPPVTIILRVNLTNKVRKSKINKYCIQVRTIDQLL